MKKRIMSIVLAFTLIFGLYNGAQLFFVDAQAGEATPDIQLSVNTDKTELRPGDEVTVTVSLDKFISTLTGDHDASVNVVPDDDEASGKPMITTMEIHLPINTDVFEFVSKKKGFVGASALNYDSSTATFNAAPSIAAYDGKIINEGTDAIDLFSFTLRVKSDVSENQNLSIDINNDSSLIFKNMYLTTNEQYSVAVKSASVDIIAKEVSNIEVSTQPQTTQYYVGSDGIDVTGGKLTVTYSNGETEVVDINSDMCGTVDLTTAGKKQVTVTYKGKTTTFDINVIEKQSVSFTLNGVDNKSVVEGMPISTEGMSADVTYDDGSVKNIQITQDMISYDTSKVGTATVTVNIDGLTQTFDVNVTSKKLESINIMSQPEKVVYLVNQEFTTTGLVVTASYNNGTNADVANKVKVSKVDMSKDGVSQVNITYTENNITKTVSFNIDIKSRETVNKLNKDIKAMLGKTLVKEDKTAVAELRNAYNALSDVEKAEADEAGLTTLESKISEILKEDVTKPSDNNNNQEVTKPSDNNNQGVTKPSDNNNQNMIKPSDNIEKVTNSETEITQPKDNSQISADIENTQNSVVDNNVKTTNPQTGDTAPIAVLVLLLAAACIALVYVMMPRHNKNK